MTTQTAEKTEPRGAGSGEHANATRGRKHDQSPTEYAKGEIAKGRIDFDKLSEGQTAEVIATRDRRAYLIDQAEKNEAANDELNAIQVEQNRDLQLNTNRAQDPDVQREESMETAIAALKLNTPEEREKQAQANRKATKDAAGSKAAANTNSPDFKAGQASG